MGLRSFSAGKAKGKTAAAVMILLLAAWTYGCRDSSHTESGLAGTWKRNVVSGTGSFVGLLTFGPDGSFAFTFDGNAVGHERSDGRYKIAGRDIKFENKSCKGVGRYRFLLKDDSLSFIPLADGCARRKAVLSGEWMRRDTAGTLTN
ncbi:MAG TPA: hypothetical protein VJV40_02010 [Thermodesulfobacteriota bacterium]|nr:hypothetical protein [Thermodesulfobacteriota bacterium]